MSWPNSTQSKIRNIFAWIYYVIVSIYLMCHWLLSKYYCIFSCAMCTLYCESISVILAHMIQTWKAHAFSAIASLCHIHTYVILYIRDIQMNLNMQCYTKRCNFWSDYRSDKCRSLELSSLSFWSRSELCFWYAMNSCNAQCSLQLHRYLKIIGSAGTTIMHEGV